MKKPKDQTIYILNRCLSWHLGDKWRNSKVKLKREAWESHHKSLTETIEELKAKG